MTNWHFGNLRMFGYGAILADPPWSYDMRSEKGYEKSPEAHYDTMSRDAIAALPVAHLAKPDCLCVLWVPAPMVDVGLSTLKAWGFTFKTMGSWHKVTASGKSCFGTGYIFRSAMEPYLVGTMGRPKLGSRSVRNVIVSERREHSRKPPEIRRDLELLTPNQFRCELFAREPWPGNDVWGNETRKFEGAGA